MKTTEFNTQIEIFDMHLDLDPLSGSFLVETTEELIRETNRIRAEKGYNDLVTAGKENDVYYTFYLEFDCQEKTLELQAQVAHGEKDDYAMYPIPIPDSVREELFWKILYAVATDLYTDPGDICP